jgi:DNA-binding MarR family transcriptional regulator
MLEQQFIGEYILRKLFYGQFALLFAMPITALPQPMDDRWRAGHLGRLLGQALRRFDERVLYLMAHDANVPLTLSNLAARAQVGAAHIHITRHLALKGSRLTELAASAGMSKQAMGDLVTQCEAWDLVRREPDPLDARARRIVFTATGLLWLEAFRLAVERAETEFRAQVGDDVATVVALGLEAYASR